MIGRAYRFAQIFSIDIVIGVVVLLRFFCVQFQVNPGWAVYVLLGVAVWLIYTADHIRDAEKSGQSTRERYIFHGKYRKVLVGIAIALLTVIVPLIFFIPVIIFIGGLALAVFSFIYLLVQHRLSKVLFKELYVALVYSMGVLMVPMFLSWTFDVIVFVLLFLLTFVNLLIFSWFERKEDEADGFQSIATQIASINLEKMILLLIALGLSISFLSFNIFHIYFLAGFIVYALMFLYSNHFRKNHLYRAVGDGVFLLPILFEWL